MAGAIALEVDDAEIRRMIRNGDREVRLGAARVLTRTGRSIRQRAAKGVSGASRVPYSKVNRRFYARRATRRQLRTIITAYVRPFNPADEAKSGGKAGGVAALGHIWPDAFIVYAKGRKLVVERKPEAATATGTDAKGRRRKGRLPVEAKKVYIRDIAEEVLAKVVERQANQMVNRDLPREVLYRLRKAARR